MRSIFIFVLAFLSFNGWANNRKQLETLPDKWQEVNISSGLNGNGYLEIEPSYTFMLNRCFGLTGGVNYLFGNADEYKYNYLTGEYEDRVLDIKTLLLRPAARFRFPIAYQHKAELFALNLEPGLYIPIGSEKYSPGLVMEKLGNTKKHWCYLNLKTSITLDLCPILVSVGYTVTEFSHEVDKYRLSHTGFIQIGYAF